MHAGNFAISTSITIAANTSILSANGSKNLPNVVTKFLDLAIVPSNLSVIDAIIEKLDIENCAVKCISLIVDEINLRKRITEDVKIGIRSEDVIERSIERIALYQSLNTIKIDTNGKTVAMIADEIKQL